MVSILVPVYNASKYLRQCVDSLTGQTYTDLQIVLIDDGSTDDSWELMQEMAQEDPRLEVYSQPNCGVAATRNHLLEKVRGEFVLFVDSDDWIELNTIEVLLEEQQKGDFDIVMFKESGKGDGKVKLFDKEQSINLFLEHHLFRGMLWNKLFKSLLLNGLTFDNSIYYGEDAAFVWQTLQRVSKVALVNKSFYHYGENEDSLSRQAFNSYKLSSYKVWDLIARETDEQWPQYSGIAHAQLAYQLTQVLLASIADQYHIEKTLRKSIQKLIRRDWHLMKDSGHTSSRMTIFSWGVSHHFKLMWFIFPVFRPYFEKKYRYM